VAAWTGSATLDFGLKAQARSRSCRKLQSLQLRSELDPSSSWDGSHHLNLPHNLFPLLITYCFYRLPLTTSIFFLALNLSALARYPFNLFAIIPLVATHVRAEKVAPFGAPVPPARNHPPT
jgi:hypothetical protein